PKNPALSIRSNNPTKVTTSHTQSWIIIDSVDAHRTLRLESIERRLSTTNSPQKAPLELDLDIG
ncbi:MAG: hypothetical protein ACRD2L_20780, partial [Terriglobia bacterium]